MKAGSVVLTGSVDRDGVPDISSRFVIATLENEKLLFADAFKNKK